MRYVTSKPLQEIFDFLIHFYSVAGITILAYDTILTLPDEILYVWTPLVQHVLLKLRYSGQYEALSLASVIHRLLLLVTRYTTLVIASIFLLSM